MSNKPIRCPECYSLNLMIADAPVENEYGVGIEVFCRDCGEEWVEVE